MVKAFGEEKLKTMCKTVMHLSCILSVKCTALRLRDAACRITLSSSLHNNHLHPLSPPPPPFPSVSFLPAPSCYSADTQQLSALPIGEDAMICMQAISNWTTELQLQVLQWRQIGRMSLLAAALTSSPELLAAIAAENEMPLGLLCPQKSVIPMVGLLCAVLRCAGLL